MKTHLIPLSFLVAASTGALAQSSIAVFGTADATLQHGSGSISSMDRLGSGNLNSSKIGFRGIEDLGDGWRAGFWLEASALTDSGVGGATNTNNQASGGSAAPGGAQGLTFARRSTVSIGGSWGELRLGRDYVPIYINQGSYDPLENVGVGTSQTQNSTLGGITAIRASNSISYLYGHPFNGTQVGTRGLNFVAMYYMGENPSNAAGGTRKDGTGFNARLGYVAGPLDIGIAQSSTKYAAGNIRQFNVGGTYDFGVLKAMGLYSRDSIGRGATGNGFLVGATAPFGSHKIRASYSTFKANSAGNPETSKLALGYVYSFSKRTQLYATVASVKNTGPANQALNGAVTAPGGSSSGYDLGLKHSF